MRMALTCYCGISTNPTDDTVSPNNMHLGNGHGMAVAKRPLVNAPDTPAAEAQTELPQTVPGECSCNIRKRQQVEARLEKKSKQEQSGQTGMDQSSQSTETSSVNGSD